MTLGPVRESGHVPGGADVGRLTWMRGSVRNSSLLALTVTVDDRQNLSMRMALAAERRRPDLGLMEPLGQHWGLFVMGLYGKWKPDALF